LRNRKQLVKIPELENLFTEIDCPWQDLISPSNDGGFTVILVDLDILAGEYRNTRLDDLVNFCLTPAEQKHFAGYQLAKRKNEWLGGRIAAKLAAMKLLEPAGTPRKLSGWEIHADPAGRPFISTGDSARLPGPDISISHSHNVAAAMAASHGFCGIDIQQLTPRINRVEEKFVTAADQQHMRTLADLDDPFQKTLYQGYLWAAKEAIRKASNRTPLPGFLEMQLAAAAGIASPGPCENPLLMNFLMQRQPDNETGKDIRVVAMKYAEYALAMTLLL